MGAAMITKTMTPEQALEWLEGLRNTPGDQVLADIEDGKAAKAAQVFRDILEADRKAVGSGLYVETVLRQFLASDGYIAECDIPHIVAALTQEGRND